MSIPVTHLREQGGGTRCRKENSRRWFSQDIHSNSDPARVTCKICKRTMPT